MKILIEKIASVAEKDLWEKPQEITEERWKKILRIRPLEDKKRSLLAGRLLHRMCQECGVTEPKYTTVKSGKPILINHPELAFSISHSGEYVVVAYEEGVAAIGADIQKSKFMSDGLKKRLLHEKEVLWLEEKMAVLHNARDAGTDGDSAAEEMVYLNRIWAIKESFVKMTGEGLSHDFRKLCVDMDEKTVTDENGRRVSFVEPEAPEGYVLAVIIEE